MSEKSPETQPILFSTGQRRTHADQAFRLCCNAVELGSHGPGKLSEQKRSPRMARGGCTRSSGPSREQRSPKESFAPPKPSIAQVQQTLAPVQEVFSLLGPRLAAPVPRHDHTKNGLSLNQTSVLGISCDVMLASPGRSLKLQRIFLIS